MKTGKLKEFIRNQIKSTLFEFDVKGKEHTETDLDSLANEYLLLSEKLKLLEDEIAPIQEKIKSYTKHAGNIEKVLISLLQSMNTETAKLDKKILQLTKEPKYKKIQPEYKGLWEELLTKVNGSIKKIMLDIRDAQISSKNLETKTALSVARTEGMISEGSIRDLFSKFKNILISIKNYLTVSKQLNKELDKMPKEGIEEDGSFLDTQSSGEFMGKINPEADKEIELLKKLNYKIGPNIDLKKWSDFKSPDMESSKPFYGVYDPKNRGEQFYNKATDKIFSITKKNKDKMLVAEIKPQSTIKLKNFVPEDSNFSKDETEKSPIDGMKKKQAVNYILKTFKVYEKLKGFFKDNAWVPINGIIGDLQKGNIPIQIDKTEYKKNDDGEPSSKMWSCTIPFINQNGRPDTLYCYITAHGAGTVQDPLDRYDITFNIG